MWLFFTLATTLLWGIADITMGGMTIINMPVIIYLGKYAIRTLNDYEKKLKKGMTVDTIADILEEEPVLIEKIIKVLKENPEGTEEELLAIVMNNVNN